MLELPHVMVGAAIATKVANPILSLPLALGSHFILERVPHWNPHLNKEVKEHGRVTSKSLKIIIADSSLALIGGSLIAFSNYPDIKKVIVILLACFLSILPDLIEAPYFFLNKKCPIIKKWITFQKSLQNDAEPLLGLTTQFLTIIAALIWIFTP